ncbi:unnamed protein product [Rotaria magnacalcarata]|uniref:Uncharacterized protein n=1 Tax=Rotaria magnacalcarata TaxID=392030 RepID=A0A816YL60_9BILA|nr:unnamed protein product [Rotaria magnacalcarata]CAF1380368.1 unnamed protein product [Rotaria magnacalcarata]CAF2161419.1 unnamed protein product [Rotaria magnacalcarata]
MKAQIPSYINLEQFNELYIDGRRAIVAKYPSGDLSIQGLYAKDPGFSYNVSRWLPPTINKSPCGGASVFNPPSNFWSTDSPPCGNNYAVPRGLIINNGALPHIAPINITQNTIVFGRGGFQEARGAASGGAFYVVNIFEELDSPNEWFLVKDTRTFYFMPNESMSQFFVARQISCLISISGSSFQTSVENISIQGLTLTETSHTYMGDYMEPSGGDWAVHRGGTLYLTNTKKITITRNIFIPLGSRVLHGSKNDFLEPFKERSSPVLIAASRSASVIGNLMFNIPRAAINANDDFYGNHTLSWNVIFNTVRETSDHGPTNTWDRQPFLSGAVQSSLPSVWQRESFIHQNTLFNNYNSFYPIDHDDGSCFYEDRYNFQVYGGKKNYLGHSKLDHHEIYVYHDTKSSQGIGVCIANQAPSGLRKLIE